MAKRSTAREVRHGENSGNQYRTSGRRGTRQFNPRLLHVQARPPQSHAQAGADAQQHQARHQLARRGPVRYNEAEFFPHSRSAASAAPGSKRVDELRDSYKPLKVVDITPETQIRCMAEPP